MAKREKQKKLTKNSYRWWGYLAVIIHYGIPITYLMIAYGLFQDGDAGLKLNGYAYLAIIIGFAFIKNFGGMLLEDIDKHLSKSFKRVFPPMIYIVIVVILYFSKYWISHLIGLLFAIAIGRLVALYPYYKYDKKKERYDLVHSVSDKEQIKADLRKGIVRVK